MTRALAMHARFRQGGVFGIFDRFKAVCRARITAAEMMERAESSSPLRTDNTPFHPIRRGARGGRMFRKYSCPTET